MKICIIGRASVVFGLREGIITNAVGTWAMEWWPTLLAD